MSYFSVFVGHIFREATFAADKLASLYLHSNRVFEDVSSLSSTVRGAMILDASGVPSVRAVVDIAYIFDIEVRIGP